MSTPSPSEEFARMFPNQAMREIAEDDLPDPTNEMTPRQVYATDDVFRLLVDEWVAERWCPRPLVDRCIELGMEAAADCCRWAATEPDRPVYHMPAEQHGEEGGRCGPYPACNNNEVPEWCWCSVGSGSSLIHAFDVPKDIPRPDEWSESKLDAILWLLENWRP